MKASTGLLRCAPDGALRARGPRVQVAAGLGLLLVVALAGCTATSPSGSQAPVVTIARVADSAGDPLQFEVRAEPAPAADLTVGVTIEPVGCALAQSPESVTIAAGESVATLTVPMTGVEVDCVVTATIAAGAGYAVGSDGTASLQRSADADDSPHTPTPGPGGGSGPEEPTGPSVTIDRIVVGPVTEGDRLRFGLTANPAPSVPLEVNLQWDDPGDRVFGTPPRTVTIPTSGRALFSVATNDDDREEFHRERWVSVTIVDGSGYVVGSPRKTGRTVSEDDRWPRVTVVADATTVNEGDTASFTLTATPAPTSTLTVNLRWLALRVPLTETPPKSVTIPTSGTAKVAVGIKDDLIDNYDQGRGVGIQVDWGDRYYPDSPGTATAFVIDDENDEDDEDDEDNKD